MGGSQGADRGVVIARKHRTGRLLHSGQANQAFISIFLSGKSGPTFWTDDIVLADRNTCVLERSGITMEPSQLIGVPGRHADETDTLVPKMNEVADDLVRTLVMIRRHAINFRVLYRTSHSHDRYPLLDKFANRVITHLRANCGDEYPVNSVIEKRHQSRLLL